MSAPPQIFDKRQLGRNLMRASLATNRPVFLLHLATEDMIERLRVLLRSSGSAAVTGLPSGPLQSSLRKEFGFQTVLALALVPNSDSIENVSYLFGDEERLPFRPASLDCLVSVLSLQVTNDLPGALIQIRRALKPDGLFLAALLGGDTLAELREAFTIAEAETTGGVSPRVFPTANVRDLGSLMQRAGFSMPVTDAEILTVTYPSPIALMRELKAMGAANPLASRSRLPMRRDTLRRAEDLYREKFETGEGRVRATFEIIYLTGWAPPERAASSPS